MTEPIRAAGGVVWRPRPAGGVEVAVVHRARHDDWSLPKGKQLPGEHPVRCAVREVREETGVRAVVGRPLPTLSYTVLGLPKTVRYWAMRVVDADAGAPDDEVDELRWLDVAAAGAMLSYDSERGVLEAFAAGPADTTTLLLVRHGSAGSRDDWPGDDALRPLDPAGVDQAAALASTGPCFGVRRVLSAEPVRCVDTVAPLAAEVGVAVEVDPAYGDHGYPARGGEVVARLRALAAVGQPTAVCSQGDTIPDLVRRLAGADGVEVPDPLPCRKGSAWALSFHADRLVAAEYHPRLSGRPGRDEAPGASPGASSWTGC